jgi:hypothetical protein
MATQNRSPLALAVAGTVALLGLWACPGATTGLERARTNANEASAIASLRVVVTSQVAYSSVCGGGFYAPTLKTLGQPGAGVPNGFIGPDLATDPAVKRGYTVTLVAGPASADAPASCNGLAAGLGVRDYFASVAPSTPGASYFAAISDGTLYKSPQPIAPVFGTRPPAPAVPVQ